MANDTKSWICKVCGYIHHDNEPPEICPVCGVDAESFKIYTLITIQKRKKRNIQIVMPEL